MFSLKWIQQHESVSYNPLSDVQFKQFIRSMDADIAKGERKRIFDSDEQIGLKPETIRIVVQELEHTFLLGIDADLNGRLFETFLNATMRGKDLGQFFTPRSLVKLGVELANLQVNAVQPDGAVHTDTVLDACCGSGGFLIDVFTDMVIKAKSLSISDQQKRSIIDDIRKNNIVGIDIGNAPNLSRVARLNMYLHGDGGTRIFHTDALDKEPQADLNSGNQELISEIAELRSIISNSKYFDVVLTNPPFAKKYERKIESKNRILNQYEIGMDGLKPRKSLKSSLLFFERYFDLLKEGGRLISVIDDGILSGDEYSWFRDFLRSHFLVKAVISLPGDAFQRSDARVKTSFIILEKRFAGLEQQQPPVFMYGCKYVGNDDPKRKRVLPGDEQLRELAREEISLVCTEYRRYLAGHGNPKYVVDPAKISDRMDMKYCWVQRERMVDVWKQTDCIVSPLSAFTVPKVFDNTNTVSKNDDDEVYTQAIVRYSGIIEKGPDIQISNTQYSNLFVINEGDIVISNIAASYGSVAVVPSELDGLVVSSEYTVLRAKPGFVPEIIRDVLRSSEIRSEILLSSTGANRTRAKWDELKKIVIAYPTDSVVNDYVSLMKKREDLLKQLKEIEAESTIMVERECMLSSEYAEDILLAFKPPK